MYKSIVALLCAMILVVSFSACSNQSDSKSPAEKSATESISSENYENAENLVTTKKAEQPIEKAEITSAEACSKISEMDIEKLGLKGKKEDYKFMVASEGRNIEGVDYIEVVAMQVIKENEDGSISTNSAGDYFVSYDGTKMLIRDMTSGDFSDLK